LGLHHGMRVKFGLWTFDQPWKWQKNFDFMDFWLPYWSCLCYLSEQTSWQPTWSMRAGPPWSLQAAGWWPLVEV